jgi:hypothetical protein
MYPVERTYSIPFVVILHGPLINIFPQVMEKLPFTLIGLLKFIFPVLLVPPTTRLYPPAPTDTVWFTVIPNVELEPTIVSGAEASALSMTDARIEALPVTVSVPPDKLQLVPEVGPASPVL